jgi:hypothetical protein
MSLSTLLALALSTLLLTTACGSKPAPEPTEPAAEPIAEPEPAPAAEPAPAPEPAPAAEPAAPDPAQVKADLLAAEKAAYEAAKPVFDANCARCHVQGQRKAKKKILGEFEITAYPFTGDHGGHEAAKHVRKVLGIDGSKPSMPADKKGAVKGDELALIAAWADAFDKAHEGGAHEGAPGHETHKH